MDELTREELVAIIEATWRHTDKEVTPQEAKAIRSGRQKLALMVQKIDGRRKL